MQTLFNIVYQFLLGCAALTGFTYREINIIAYYILIPFVFFALVDLIFKFHYTKLIFSSIVIIALLFIDNFTLFSNALFQLSVDFLNSFTFLGWNYIEASVIICVFLPLLILLGLMYLARKKQRSKNH